MRTIRMMRFGEQLSWLVESVKGDEVKTTTTDMMANKIIVNLNVFSTFI